jgi:hypothetical protein
VRVRVCARARHLHIMYSHIPAQQGHIVFSVICLPGYQGYRVQCYQNFIFKCVLYCIRTRIPVIASNKRIENEKSVLMVTVSVILNKGRSYRIHYV